MSSGGRKTNRDGSIPASRKPGETASFGKRLAYARELAGLSVAQLAVILGSKPETVQFWEDNTQEPGSGQLVELSGVLGVSLSWLLTGVGSEPDESADVGGFSEGTPRAGLEFEGMSEDGNTFLDRNSAAILRKIAVWTTSESEALAWYKSYPIVEFGDRTAETLVNAGQGDALLDYLDAVAAGSFQ